MEELEWDFSTVSRAENSRANRDEKQRLWIFNHSSRAAPPILSAYDAFEKKKYANIESTRSFDVAVGWR